MQCASTQRLGGWGPPGPHGLACFKRPCRRALCADVSCEYAAYSQQPKSSFIKVMMERGFLHSCTNIEELDKQMEAGLVTAYLGFDATASSLHVGLLPLPASSLLLPPLPTTLLFPPPWRRHAQRLGAVFRSAGIALGPAAHACRRACRVLPWRPCVAVARACSRRVPSA